MKDYVLFLTSIIIYPILFWLTFNIEELIPSISSNLNLDFTRIPLQEELMTYGLILTMILVNIVYEHFGSNKLSFRSRLITTFISILTINLICWTMTNIINTNTIFHYYNYPRDENGIRIIFNLGFTLALTTIGVYIINKSKRLSIIKALTDNKNAT